MQQLGKFRKCCNTEGGLAGCNWLEGPVVAICVRDSEASGSERDEEIDKCRGYQLLVNNSTPNRYIPHPYVFNPYPTKVENRVSS